MRGRVLYRPAIFGAVCALPSSEPCHSHEREAPIVLPSGFHPRTAIYFRTLILKSEGGSNSDRDGSLNCTLVS